MKNPPRTRGGFGELASANRHQGDFSRESPGFRLSRAGPLPTLTGFCGASSLRFDGGNSQPRDDFPANVHLGAMVRRVVLFLIVALGAASFSSPQVQAADYSEFVTGDLSGDPALPTQWSLAPGSNTLVASSSSSDQDLIRFDIPAGYVLSTIVVKFHEGLNRVFTGIQRGTSWTAGIGFDVDPTNMLGWADFPFHPENSHQEADILAAIGEAPGSIGFTGPLGSGTYTMLFQARSIIVPYALEFNVTQVGGGSSADFNRDGLVNGSDLALWRQSFGAGTGADANNDGRTDGEDFLIWQRQTGQSGTVSAVPEPAAALLAALAIGAGAACRRRGGSVRSAAA